ncbi:MAG: hypothetical protein RLY86_3535 [Pseudomonadota bacterium]|jgi:hypothetical protein
MALFSETARYRRKYAMVREGAYQSVLERIAPYYPGLLTDIRDIDDAALSCWRREWLPCTPPDRAWSDWDWSREVRAWRRHVDCFEVAIWSDNHLCGMALGKPSDARNNMSVYLLQGSPVPNHPLSGQVLPIILESAASYGYALGCRELRLVKPLDGPMSRYQSMGFRLVNARSSAPYCVRSI